MLTSPTESTTFELSKQKASSHRQVIVIPSYHEVCEWAKIDVTATTKLNFEPKLKIQADHNAIVERIRHPGRVRKREIWKANRNFKLPHDLQDTQTKSKVKSTRGVHYKF